MPDDRAGTPERRGRTPADDRGAGPTRRAVVAGAAGGALTIAAPTVLRAAGPRYRIFQILFRGPTDVERGFADYLRSRRIDAEYIVRSAERDPARVPAFVAEGKALGPDLWYTWGTPVSIATFGRWDTPDPAAHVVDRPGVFSLVSTPVESGVVPSLERPDRNITGVFHIVPIPAQIRFMRSYRPFDRLGMIYNPIEQNSVGQVRQVEALQQEMGFVLLERPFPLGDDGLPIGAALPEMLASLKRDGAECLLLPADTFIGSLAQEIRAATIAEGLLPFAFTEFSIRSGIGAAGIVARYYMLGQLNGSKAERILRDGVWPGDIPVDTLSRFSLIINVAFAAELGMYPPLAMIDNAEIIHV